MDVKFNFEPVIVNVSDISDIHQEIKGFEYCLRIDFKEPFAEYELPLSDSECEEAIEEMEAHPNYDKAQHDYEMAARDRTGIQQPDGLFDWRDEQELWLRYNMELDTEDLMVQITSERGTETCPYCNGPLFGGVCDYCVGPNQGGGQCWYIVLTPADVETMKKLLNLTNKES